MLVIKLFKIRFLEKLVVIGSVTVLVLLAGTGFADADIAKKSEPQVQVVSLAVSPKDCLLYTSPSPRDGLLSRMPSSA